MPHDHDHDLVLVDATVPDITAPASGITKAARAFWFQVAEKLGIPTAFLLLACGAAWLVASWVGTEILKPAADRHLQFIDSVELSVKQQANTLEVISRNSAMQLEAMETMSDEQRAMAKWCEATSKSGEQQEMLLEEIKAKLNPGECD